MSDVSEKLPEIEERVMSGLKDFQKATVERIDFLFRNGQKRILVSDEVGLGKTLIAKGTIAKFARMRKEQGDDLVKVVYICSNSAIADQNLNKLRITNELRSEGIGSSRLSMQHLNIFNQEHDSDLLNRYIQLIPLTPDTSFKIKSGRGRVGERALMFAILRRVPELSEYEKELETALIWNAEKAWNGCREYYENEVLQCNERSHGEYLKYMIAAVEKELKKEFDGRPLLSEIMDVCREIRTDGKPDWRRKCMIGHLRVMFSEISLEKLDPDLVIMDEFQRFKYLINSDTETETGMLADKFFNSENARILMLSATPYKMYSTLDEIDETHVDEHYSEFLDVMKFLNNDEKKQTEFEEIWNDYSIQLKEFSKGSSTLLEAKNRAEDAMYEKICRTERISAKETIDMIDAENVRTMKIKEEDVVSYISMQKLLNDMNASFHVPVDYVKSCPYLLSFMRDYKLKKKIEDYYRAHPDLANQANESCLWLKRDDIENYRWIPAGNARLDVLMEHAFRDSAEKLLWVPPSLPYYEPRGAYKDVKNFSKTLVFSSWEMVPRMIAGMVSYEAERRPLRKIMADSKSKGEKSVRYSYFDDKKKYAKRHRYPSGRLSFARDSDGKLAAMSLFCLMYPSDFLTECYKPSECLNEKLSLEETEERIKASICGRLSEFKAEEDAPSDKTWYYIAPLLLDDEKYVNSWFDGIAKLLSDNKDDNKDSVLKSDSFHQHVSKLRELYDGIKSGAEKLGSIPGDLQDLLVDMAISSPAVCIGRTYRKYNEEFNPAISSEFAQTFMNRMNTSESTAVIDLCYGASNEAYWRNLLKYCKDGNFQAVLDEYAHLVANGLDRDKEIVDTLHGTVIESMSLKTTTYQVDTFSSFNDRMSGRKGLSTSMRTHFAVAFTKGEGDDSGDRKKAVRNAFNSPFRPFVLASTSIGQEGLDFHYYCRRIVHWNLPSNPIDIEQREGRINRFECLAVRQNIVKRYGDSRFTKDDVWTEMLETASRKTSEENRHSSDLIPYWELPEEKDMIKIERIVPQYPFSKDISLYERMIQILSLYRLTLGQPRQEELLDYIIKNSDGDTDLKELFINLSPLYKKKDE